jgi:predicted DNA repair protein MutK
VSAEREIPVVWAVAKGSLKNKAILVPAAILISLFLPWAIIPLLMIGGAYLCFEGTEKLVHKFIHSKDEINKQHATELKAVQDANVDLVEFEKKKIKGAIRTDFILSAEIIAITLGTTADASLMTQATVLTVIALVMTIGVYGLVGGLVKIDDLGLHLYQAEGASSFKRNLGSMLLSLAPKLMKFLSIAGTIAMFLVGGGILVHGVSPLHHLFEHWQEALAHGPVWVSWSQHILMTLMNGLTGIIAGGLLVGVFQLIQSFTPSKTQN